MQHVLTTAHSDKVSGCTMFSNGTRAFHSGWLAFWTEGQNPAVHIIYADGTVEEAAHADKGEPHPVILALIRCDLTSPSRLMTPQEEAEIAAVRGWDCDDDPFSELRRISAQILEERRKLG